MAGGGRLSVVVLMFNILLNMFLAIIASITRGIDDDLNQCPRISHA